MARQDDRLIRVADSSAEAEHNVGKPETKLLGEDKPVLAASIVRNVHLRYFLVQDLSEEILRLCASWENLAASLRSSSRSRIASMVKPEHVRQIYDRILTEMMALSQDARRLLEPTSEMRLLERVDTDLLRPAYVLPRGYPSLARLDFEVKRVMEPDEHISYKLVVPVFDRSQWWWTPAEELSVDAKLLHDRWLSSFYSSLIPSAPPGIRVEARRAEGEMRSQLLREWRLRTALRVQAVS